MDKVLSARVDEFVVRQIGELAHRLHTSKKRIIEKAIEQFAKTVESEGEDDVLARTCGAWTATRVWQISAVRLSKVSESRLRQTSSSAPCRANSSKRPMENGKRRKSELSVPTVTLDSSHCLTAGAVPGSAPLNRDPIPSGGASINVVFR